MLNIFIKVAGVFLFSISTALAAGNVYSSAGSMSIGKPQLDMNTTTDSGSAKNTGMTTVVPISQQNVSGQWVDSQPPTVDKNDKIERDFYRTK